MTTSRTSYGARRSAAEWRALMARFGHSGLNIAAFCQRESISEASFYRWRGLLAADHPVSACVSPAASSASSHFIDMGALTPAPASSERLEIRLDLGAGLVLHLVRG